MLNAIDAVLPEARPLAEPRGIGELLPEVLARYGIDGRQLTVHAAHAKADRRHRGPRQTGQQRNAGQRNERERTMRGPSPKRRLSAAG